MGSSVGHLVNGWAGPYNYPLPMALKLPFQICRIEPLVLVSSFIIIPDRNQHLKEYG
jgi:hypothetical protein